MMNGLPGLKVLFVAGFGLIARDPEASRILYGDRLGLPLIDVEGATDYRHTEDLAGVKHFALWPLAHVAQSCFGTDVWPDDRTTPQAWIEFEVENVASATTALAESGVDLLVVAREEPWGQTVTRFIDPDGVLVGVTHTPWLREA